MLAGLASPLREFAALLQRVHAHQGETVKTAMQLHGPFLGGWFCNWGTEEVVLLSLRRTGGKRRSFFVCTKAENVAVPSRGFVGSNSFISNGPQLFQGR